MNREDMKTTRFLFPLLILTVFLLSFTGKEEIGSCYISFFNASGLTAFEPERIPETADKFRTLMTDQGEVQVTRTDGYRILYGNAKKAVFVNLKVELSEKGTYEENKKNIRENLKYLAAHTSGMETQGVIEKELNGYTIYGISRTSIEKGSTLGIFAMFPGNGIIVYFYFNNLPPETRNFENVDEYNAQRDRFMEEYTKYLTTCKEK
jgi:hypothetical protein